MAKKKKANPFGWLRRFREKRQKRKWDQKAAETEADVRVNMAKIEAQKAVDLAGIAAGQKPTQMIGEDFQTSGQTASNITGQVMPAVGSMMDMFGNIFGKGGQQSPGQLPVFDPSLEGGGNSQFNPNGLPDLPGLGGDVSIINKIMAFVKTPIGMAAVAGAFWFFFMRKKSRS